MLQDLVHGPVIFIEATLTSAMHEETMGEQKHQKIEGENLETSLTLHPERATKHE